MAGISELISGDAIIPELNVNSKKQALQEIAQRISSVAEKLSESVVFEALLQREKLGSTAIGQGVAVPHIKLPGLSRLFGVMARLKRPIDFDASDGQPVDLIFTLVAPEGAGADHLKALSKIACTLQEPGYLEKLRACIDGADIQSLFLHEEDSQ